MPNFGLSLLLNWRPLRKTSCLKIKGLWGTIIFNLQKRSWKGCKNRATRRQTGELPNNEPTKGTRAATRPFLAKKKGDTVNRCRHTERSKELLEQFLFLLTPYNGETSPQSLHWNIHLPDDDFMNDFRGKPSQAYCLCHNPGINTDGFRQFSGITACMTFRGIGPRLY